MQLIKYRQIGKYKMTNAEYVAIDAPYIKDLTPYQLDRYYERCAVIELDGGFEPKIAAKMAYEEARKM